MTRIKDTSRYEYYINESRMIKDSIVKRIKDRSQYPCLYSVIQFGFYDNQGILLPPDIIRQYWDKGAVKKTCRLIYNMLKESCSIDQLYFFIERHAPKRSSIKSGKEVKGRFHLNIISSQITDNSIVNPNRKMRRLMTEEGYDKRTSSDMRNSIKTTGYNRMNHMKIDLFNACCRRANWVNRYKYAINTQVLYEPTDLEKTVLYSLKDYEDNADGDFMDLVVFESSDFNKTGVPI